MEKNRILARLRVEQGMTQKELAEELHVTRQAISQWESGTTMPSMEKLLALSRIFGVPAEELYGGGVVRETEVEPEAPPETPCATVDKNAPKRGRLSKKIILLVPLAVLYLSIYIWGVATNSKSLAIANLFYFSVILLAATILYGVYQLILYLMRKER